MSCLASPNPLGSWPCPKCKYDLRGSIDHDSGLRIVCPECGRQWHVDDLRDSIRDRVSRGVTPSWLCHALAPSLVLYIQMFEASYSALTWVYMSITGLVSFPLFAWLATRVMPTHVILATGKIRPLCRVEKALCVAWVTGFLVLMNALAAFLWWVVIKYEW